MVEEAAVLVVREEERGATPLRRAPKRVDQALLETHADRDVRGRMLVPPVRITRYHPRDLRQLALARVVEERTLRPQRAVVVLVLLPEKEDVVRVAVGDAVEADVVDLPRDSGLVEQVEDHRVAEDAEAPDAVRRDPARSARREVEPVRPRRPEDRAEVVRAERRVVEQAVVERQLPRGVVADRGIAVARILRGHLVEAVHLAVVHLRVHGLPPVRRVGRRELRELERRMPPARGVGLRVARRRSEPLCLNLRRVAVVVVERAVLLAGDDQLLDRRAAPGAARAGRHGRGRPECPAKHSGSGGA